MTEQNKSKLNSMMREVSELRKAESRNKGRIRSLKNNCATLLCAAFLTKGSDIEDDILNLIWKALEEYDHERSDNFYCYFTKYLKFKCRNHKIEQIKNGRMKSIDDPIVNSDGGSENKLIDIIPNEREMKKREDREKVYDAYNYNIINAVLRSRNHNMKGDKLQERYRYYTAFASEAYILLCKSVNYKDYDLNETEAFAVMDNVFNDFVFVRQCRSFDDMTICSFKTYKKAEIDDDPSEITISRGDKSEGFEGRVFAAYFNVTKPAISEQKGYFKKEIAIML
ncbi:MAG: hypothetical protein IJ141_05640 [Lachnospiraceae bacterium]|nr:hypothetical protein [Lachnospiraceae bacterium]